MECADIKQKGVVINLDKERRLIFSLNAMCEIDDKYGDIYKAMEEMQKGRMKAIRFLLYVGLLEDDETLTEKIVGSLIDINNIQDVMHKLNTAMIMSTPKSSETDEKN